MCWCDPSNRTLHMVRCRCKAARLQGYKACKADLFAWCGAALPDRARVAKA